MVGWGALLPFFVLLLHAVQYHREAIMTTCVNHARSTSCWLTNVPFWLLYCNSVAFLFLQCRAMLLWTEGHLWPQWHPEIMFRLTHVVCIRENYSQEGILRELALRRTNNSEWVGPNNVLLYSLPHMRHNVPGMNVIVEIYGVATVVLIRTCTYLSMNRCDRQSVECTL